MPQSKTAAQIIIAKIIRPRMKSRKITIYKLWQLTDIPKTTLYDWFHARQDIPFNSFIKILTALEINIHLVFKEDDPLTYDNRLFFN